MIKTSFFAKQRLAQALSIALALLDKLKGEEKK